MGLSSAAAGLRRLQWRGPASAGCWRAPARARIRGSSTSPALPLHHGPAVPAHARPHAPRAAAARAAAAGPGGAPGAQVGAGSRPKLMLVDGDSVAVRCGWPCVHMHERLRPRGGRRRTRKLRACVCCGPRGSARARHAPRAIGKRKSATEPSCCAAQVPPGAQHHQQRRHPHQRGEATSARRRARRAGSKRVWRCAQRARAGAHANQRRREPPSRGSSYRKSQPPATKWQ